jgi:hypothetical protein
LIQWLHAPLHLIAPFFEKIVFTIHRSNRG